MSLNFGQSLFPPRGELIKSFNYIDVLTGNGYVTFYLATGYDSTGTLKNFLTTQLIESQTTVESFYQHQDTGFFDWTKQVDSDYDTQVEISSIIKGIAYLRVLVTTSITDNNTNTKCYLQARIRKWDGTTETEIASAKTLEIDRTTDGSNQMYQLKFDITTPTHFNPGDTLRITIELWATLVNSINANDAVEIGYEFDPASRTKYAINYGDPTSEDDVYQYPATTDCKISIPFKVNI